ncbi:MAG TPA: hypothetical protein VFE36_02310 [Candidatus Baltobacteraceae bacterium]|jgi:hypothetical protein|nr:hypothetical protein [Candidatus Baltobacteraceae bacterium]
MLEIAEGSIRALYLFDVADTIDLAQMTSLGGENRAPAELPLRPHTSPAYLQFPVPPLVATLDPARIGDLECSVRLKFYDYGVMSLRLSFDCRGTWNELVALADRVRTDEKIARFAETTVARVRDEHLHALDDPHPPLVEDYHILEINRFSEAVDAETLLDEHAADLASLLLGERRRLSASESEESLRTRFSYYDDDLTVVQWDAAFVYDRPESGRAIEDILEFANSQLLELRTYDALLDRELDSIYKMQPGASVRSVRGTSEAEKAAVLRYLIVDVLELIDRSSNALKIVGDAYYARIYRTAAARLGLNDWQRQIDAKLASVGEMYRFFTDEARSRRDVFLEWIVIVLIALEIVVGVFTLIHH